MAELTVAELRSFYFAARWTKCFDDDECCWFDDHMRKHAGRNWRSNLRRALAEVSRELAKATFTKRRK